LLAPCAPGWRSIRFHAPDGRAGLVVEADACPLGGPAGVPVAEPAGVGLHRLEEAGLVVQTADVARAAGGERIAQVGQRRQLPLAQLEEEPVLGGCRSSSPARAAATSGSFCSSSRRYASIVRVPSTRGWRAHAPGLCHS
jgi:hypothetical protein